MDYSKIFSFRDDEDTPRPFLEHLEELRRTILVIVGTLVTAMILCFSFRGLLAHLLQHPLLQVDPTRSGNLQSLGVADSMTISLELAFYAGFVVAFPIILYFIARFLFPALNKAEKKLILPVVALSLFLFLVGISFSYYIVLPGTLHFFFKDAQAMHWTPLWTVRDYYSFTTQFLMAFGLAFEMPIVVLALVKLDILTATMLRKARAIAIVIIFTVAAFITPSPDMMTYLLMGVPMVLLYELCILLASYITPKKSEKNKDENNRLLT